jgi:hypothetical protein
MDEKQIAAICKRCKKVADEWKSVPTSAETNKIINDIKIHARALRIALEKIPYVVHVNLPANLRRMLEPEKYRKSDDPVTDAVSRFRAKQEPELLRTLSGIEKAVTGSTAMVNKKPGKQRDFYAECILEEMERWRPHSKYENMHALIRHQTGRFKLDPTNLYEQWDKKVKK